MRNFGRFMEQIDVLELYELKDADLSLYELLFTSYNPEELTFLPKSLTVFQLDPFSSMKAPSARSVPYSSTAIITAISRFAVICGRS